MSAEKTCAAAFVARQPIFDRDKRACAYELLFRSGLEESYQGSDGDASSLEVIANSFIEMGLDELTGNKRGFINFTRNLLLSDVADLLPPEWVTIEILEDVEPDKEVLSACKHLKDLGYALALDDFVLADRGSPLLDVANIVKVDFAGTTPEDRKRLTDELNPRGIECLAEKVETHQEFAEAMACGFVYFQGYFFSKPVTRTTNKISGNKLAYLRTLQEINRPELSYEDLEAGIKQDVSLTYKLLRFINSVWFGLRHEVKSIKHALVWLGPKEVRKWFSLVSLRDMGGDKPDELIRCAMLRARMGELLAPLVGLKANAANLFLMGIFSVLDAMLDAPLEEVIAKLPLDKQVHAALLGEPSKYRQILEMIVSYEQGDWQDFADRAAELRFDPNRMPAIFNESVTWAEAAFSSSS